MNIINAIDVFKKYIECRSEDYEVCISYDGCGGCPHASTDADIVESMKVIVCEYEEKINENNDDGNINEEDAE